MTALKPVKRVEVVSYDKAWKSSFEAERRRLKKVLGSAAIAIHHVGSTSVPGMSAKPVIDILVEATDLKLIDVATEALEQEGFEAKGEYGIPDRRYFSRLATVERLGIHVHAFERGSSHIAKHLQFRDFLRAHPDDATSYGLLKRELASAFAEDRGAYQAGKAEFIRELALRAKEWSRRSR